MLKLFCEQVNSQQLLSIQSHVSTALPRIGLVQVFIVR